MEDKDIKPDLCNCNGVGPIRYMRDFPPAHFTFKIGSYSLLSKTQLEKIESSEFESGGYKWRLSMYPNGDKTRNGDGHISLYLSISDTSKLSPGWEVLVNFKLFVFDQMRDKYLTIHDNSGGIRRFYSIRTEWGFAQLLSLDALRKTSNGYLVNDSCVFGAEVFVIKCSGKWECFTMIKELDNFTHTYEIQYFSYSATYPYSQEFKVGKTNWKLLVYPNGNPSAKGNDLSLYIQLDDTATGNFPHNQKLYVEFKLRIRDQVSGHHRERTATHWFCASAKEVGFPNFISQTGLNRASNGFLTNHLTLIVEAEFMAMSEANSFP